MTKCDFCTKSRPGNVCYWESRIAAEHDCEKAINKMVKAFGSMDGKKKKKLLL